MITDSWDSVLSCFDAQTVDVYFLEEYCALYVTKTRAPRAIVYQEGPRLLVLPILIGEIPQRPGFYDFETPYGYGGPLTNSADSGFLVRAYESMVYDCQSHHVVAGFVRFHPVLCNYQLPAFGRYAFRDRTTVVMDLLPEPERIWSEQVSAKNRSMIRKAGKSGCVFAAERDFSDMDAFRSLYMATMERREADRYYYFSNEYFDGLSTGLSGHAFLSFVRCQGRPAAAAIFLFSGPFGHYHLSASDPQYQAAGVNNFLLYSSALFLRSLGVRWLHLGGGTDSDEHNSLLSFKKRFSPNTREFYIGKYVFDRPRYDELCAEADLAAGPAGEHRRELLLRYRR